MFGRNKEDVKRRKYLEEITRKAGRIEILSDKIVCYIDGAWLKKQCKKYGCYVLGVLGIQEEDNTEYGLSSNIVYVVDGFHFDERLKCYNNFATIVFKNCTFDDDIKLMSSNPGEVVFENNKYGDNSWIENYVYVSDKVTFVNEGSVKGHINIHANKVSIYNSNLGSESKKNFVGIGTPELIIEHSSIKAEEVWIDVDTIKGSNSKLEASSAIYIKSKKFNPSLFTVIDTPHMSYNGVIIEGTDKCLVDEIIDRDEKRPLRTQLVSLLSAISNNYENVRYEKIKSLNDSYDKKPIGKVLSRKPNRH